MRRPLIAGNWKMHKTAAEAAMFGEQLVTALTGGASVETLVCPPFTALAVLHERLAGTDIRLGAQNMHEEAQGAFTGEVSATMLKDAGCSYVILGHSERRQMMGETDQRVNAKVKAAVAAGLYPIVCVGESLDERQRGLTEAVVTGQVGGAFADVSADALATAVIAYEPIWAIGSGETATAEDANHVAAVIRETIANLFGEDSASAVRIQYGGSVKADNIAAFMSQPHIDGALVGGASLAADSFAQIVRNTEASAS